MDHLVQNLRFALRQFARRPGFTLVAAVTLALGIGANTAIFSVVSSVLLRPLPYADADGLVTVWNSLTGSGFVSLSEPELIDYREEIGSFDKLAAYRFTESNLTGDGEPERIPAARVTANLFGTLGRPPAVGRAFTAGEDRPDRDNVVILSEGLWQRRFGGDPSVVGRTIQVDGRARTVIGVMPPGFRLPADLENEQPSEMWLPLALDPENLAGRGQHFLQAVARLAPGATPAQATAELELLTRHWVAEGIVQDEAFTAFAVPLRDEVIGDIRQALLILFAAVGFVLLIACANVANLMLARADERSREFAVRTALGADRGRIVGQLLTESLVLALLGGAAGLILAAWGIEAIGGLAPATIPGLDAVSLDAKVLAFTALVSIVAAIVFSVLPAIQTVGRDVISPLKEGGQNASAGRGRQRARRSLAVAEVALAVVLVIGAGLLFRSFQEMRQVELGFDPENVLTFQLTLPQADYAGSERMIDFYAELRDRVEATSGVHSVGATALLPLDQSIGDWGIDIEGRERGPGERFQGYLQIITPGYLESMRIPLVSGREMEETDRADGQPVVVINERMAERYWPGEEALGRRLRIRADDPGPWFTVVGVVADIRHNAIIEEPRHEMYFPHAQLPLALGGTTAAMNLVVRTTGQPLAMTASIREIVRSIDPNLPLANVRTMERVVDRALAKPRFTMVLLGVFAALALLLGAVGIYGVMAYGVTRRSREIGIRMALGAGTGSIIRMVVLQGIAIVGSGVALGLTAAFALSGVVASLLYGVSATDPLTFLSVPMLLGFIALAAAWLPARRATRMDPVVALRAD